MRANRTRHFLTDDDGVWTFLYHFDAPIGVVWEALVAPENKQRWMDQIKTVTVDNSLERLGTGSAYHCAHELADFFYRVTDWEPFDYFSTRIQDPARPEISWPETYHLQQIGGGTDLRYTMGKATDSNGNRSEISEQEGSAFLAQFWATSFAEMDTQLRQSK